MIRSMPALEVRALEKEGAGVFEARVLTYNVRDDYNTEFAPGLFNDSLKDKMPRIAWGHDWRQVIGRWTAFREDGPYLVLRGQLDLMMIEGTQTPAVPLAHQAYAQLKSGTIDEFSVGFVPLAYEDIQEEDGDYFRRFTKGRLDEVSLVLAGAVPDTKLLSVRSGEGGNPVLHHLREPLVSKEQVAALILKVHGGEVDLAEALTELKSLPVVADSDDEPEEGEVNAEVAGGASDGDPGSEAPEGAEAEGDAADGDPAPDPAAAEGEPEADDDEVDAELEALLAEADAVLEALDA